MKKPSKKNRVAQTMTQAAKLLDVPLSIVKLAKRSGANCFLASGRVKLAGLRKHLRDHPNGAPGLENGPGKAMPMAPVDLSDVEKSLAAAISVEEKNLQLLRAAQDRNDAVAVQSLSDAFQKSQKNRLSYERAVREELTRRGELIPLEAHRRQLFKVHVPAVNRMRSLARVLPIRLVNLDEIAIEKILAQAVEAVLAELQHSIGEKPDADFYWQSWLLCILDDDPTGGRKALESLEAARARLVAAMETVHQPEIEPAKQPVFTSEN